MDWIKFLQANRIPYLTSGPRTTKGWVEIRCPFCGSADPSAHMGIKLKGRRWNCWRNPVHTGSDPAKLIQQLLGCSYSEARAFVSVEPTVGLQDHEITTQLWKHLGVEDERPRGALSLEDEGLKPLASAHGVLVEPVLNYLRGRGYVGSSLRWLIESYELHYALEGRYAHRVVFPIRDRYGKLLTWVGRSIRKRESLRYLAQPVSPREGFKQVALTPTKKTLLGLPLLWRVLDPRVLVICEGPFDAVRISSVGQSLGVYATCLFGLTLSVEQLTLLAALRQRFPVMVVLLDASTGFQPFRLANAGLDCVTRSLQDAVRRDDGSSPGDPGEMEPIEVLSLCTSLLRLPTGQVEAR